MPEPCKARKGSERKDDAEDVGLLINVLTNRNCGCEIHDIGCFAAIAQSFGFHATRIIIDQRLLRYSNPSDYVKKSQSNLEETLRRLINLQQHKLYLAFLLIKTDFWCAERYSFTSCTFQPVLTQKCCLKYRIQMRPHAIGIRNLLGNLLIGVL